MGSEQSYHLKGEKNPKRSQSTGHDDSKNSKDKRRSPASPRPSICSDSDIPYVSYTTTRPISEESTEKKSLWLGGKAKTRDKQINRARRDNKSKSAGSIVVVKGAVEPQALEKDVLFLRLAEIPPFSPIIRGSLKVPWTTDPDIAEKVDPTPVLRISMLYLDRLRKHSQEISEEQEQLRQSVEETDFFINSIMQSIMERQKQFARYSEKLNRVNELSNSLAKCHCILNETLASIETLNNLLPTEERLEPFVWTTG